ncbi:MAG TPA: SDR family oxidoreductase [Mycobacteriales bacterium]|nr:SDR family oxidoreductase [Mycobacteriales bacterium]
MADYVVTGAASGMGAATAARLCSDGHRVIGIDRRDADVAADLGTVAGRRDAIAAVHALTESLAGIALFAGLGGATGRPAHDLVSVNYFGSIDVLVGLRPLLAAAAESYALLISSNSTTCQPGWDPALVEACLDGDEARACEIADQRDSVMAYPATKTAVAHWARRHAPTDEWIGAGIRLNALAPGLVETPLAAAQRDDPVLGPFVRDFPVPVGRGATAAELAEVAVFLLEPTARFFCGSVVCCDGGTEALLRPDDWPARWQL